MSAAPKGFWQTVRHHEAALRDKVAREGQAPDRYKDIGKFRWIWPEDAPFTEAPPPVACWIGMRRHAPLITMSRLVVRNLLSYDSPKTPSPSDGVLLETMYMYGGLMGMRAHNRMLVVNSGDRVQLDPDAPASTAPKVTAASTRASYKMGLMTPQPYDYDRVLKVLDIGAQQDYELPPRVQG